MADQTSSPESSLEALKERIRSASGPFTFTTLLPLLAERLRQEGISVNLRRMPDLNGLDSAQISVAMRVLSDIIGESLPQEVVDGLAVERRRAANQ